MQSEFVRSRPSTANGLQGHYPSTTMTARSSMEAEAFAGARTDVDADDADGHYTDGLNCC